MGRLRRYKIVKITPTLETYEIIARNIKEAKNIILDRGLPLYSSTGDSTYEIIDVQDLTEWTGGKSLSVSENHTP